MKTGDGPSVTEFASAYSGHLLAGMMIFLAIGVARGVWYPTYVGTIQEGAMSVLEEHATGFPAWLLFVAACSAAGAGLAVSLCRRGSRMRGASTAWWVVVSTMALTVLASATAQVVAGPLHIDQAGDRVTVLAPAGVSPVMVVIPAFIASIGYWTALCSYTKPHATHR